MIKIENTDVYGFQHAIRGMRNAFRSWDKSDSDFLNTGYLIGENDLSLMKRLAKAGSDEAKYRRMIVVYADITAPLYWWKEYDTYKVGTVALSESTMHSIADKEFTKEDFSIENLYNPDTAGVPDHEEQVTGIVMETVIRSLNYAREAYLELSLNLEKGIGSKEDIGILKKIWWQMIQLLPSSYNQHRTVMLNYEVLANMYHARRNHRLDEWKAFCEWAEGLPYSEVFTGKETLC